MFFYEQTLHLAITKDGTPEFPAYSLYQLQVHRRKLPYAVGLMGPSIAGPHLKEGVQLVLTESKLRKKKKNIGNASREMFSYDQIEPNINKFSIAISLSLSWQLNEELFSQKQLEHIISSHLYWLIFDAVSWPEN